MSAPLRLSRPTQAGTRKLAIRATRRARSESRVPSPESRLSAIHRQPAALRGYHLAYPRDHCFITRRVEHVGDGIGELDAIGLDITARGYRREIGRATCRERVCQYV